MKLPTLKIGDLTAKLPIIQGGMGVGVSLSGLASAVANEGGVGIISGVQIGFREKDFSKDSLNANIRALRKEIRKARDLSPNGIIGVNLMVAIKNYKDMVKAAVDEKIDLIISGAGLPTELPSLVKGSKTKIAPIVSSSKAASTITRLWQKRYDYLPDLVIVEGPQAGGHLGFSKEELVRKETSLLDTIKDVVESLKKYRNKDNPIPVIAAGGIFSGQDIVDSLKAGASGVQMGTRFIATEECDASYEFKNEIVKAEKEDIKIIMSPVGMPGRAIRNSFIKRIEKEKERITKCYRCLTPCDPKTSPYCITTALINAVNGDVDNGLIFASSKAYKIKKIITVKELLKELIGEIEKID